LGSACCAAAMACDSFSDPRWGMEPAIHAAIRLTNEPQRCRMKSSGPVTVGGSNGPVLEIVSEIGSLWDFRDGNSLNRASRSGRWRTGGGVARRGRAAVLWV
jgi:hypothetical protein